MSGPAGGGGRAFAAGGCGFFLTATTGVPGPLAGAGGATAAGLAGTGSNRGAGDTCSGAAGAAVFCGRRLLCRGGSACLGASRGDTVGFGIDGEDEGPGTKVEAARLRKARMIFVPAVRITVREAGNKDLTIGMPGMSSDDSRTTRGFPP